MLSTCMYIYIYIYMYPVPGVWFWAGLKNGIIPVLLDMTSLVGAQVYKCGYLLLLFPWLNLHNFNVCFEGPRRLNTEPFVVDALVSRALVPCVPATLGLLHFVQVAGLGKRFFPVLMPLGARMLSVVFFVLEPKSSLNKKRPRLENLFSQRGQRSWFKCFIKLFLHSIG